VGFLKAKIKKPQQLASERDGEWAAEREGATWRRRSKKQSLAKHANPKRLCCCGFQLPARF